MTKTKTPVKKRAAAKTTRSTTTKRKAVTGRGGLKTAKKFDLKRALPFIVILAIVGGLFAFRSYAATSDPTGCRAVPEDFKIYRGAQVPSWLVEQMYQQFHNEVPTQDELMYWSSTRVNELRRELGESKRCAIQYRIMLEIKATTPKMRAEKDKDKANLSGAVLKTVYPNEMNNGSVDTRSGTGATRRAGSYSNLALMPVKYTRSGQPGVKYAGTWGSNWPSQVRVCAIVYSSNRGKSVTLQADAKNTATKKAVIDSLPSLNSGKLPYKVTPEDGRERTVAAFRKVEVCTDSITKRAASGSRPSTYSISIAPGEAFDRSDYNYHSRPAEVFVESFRVVKLSGGSSSVKAGAGASPLSQPAPALVQTETGASASASSGSNGGSSPSPTAPNESNGNSSGSVEETDDGTTSKRSDSSTSKRN